ncbi:hypothetical protein AHF37_10910, partial [Paragonimus kellicotti]
RFYRRRAYELHLSQEPTSKYSNRVSFPLECGRTGCCNSNQTPLDSWLKAATCVIGIIGEVYTGFDHNWRFVHIGNAQHSTMFATFGLSGIVELLMFYGLLKTSVQVEYIFSFVALMCEGFLFVFHLHGRTPLDIYLHMLLSGMILATIMVGLSEVIHTQQLVYALMRNWCLLVQGTWFWQVGAILYPTTSWMPVWDGFGKTKHSPCGQSVLLPSPNRFHCHPCVGLSNESSSGLRHRSFRRQRVHGRCYSHDASST